MFVVSNAFSLNMVEGSCNISVKNLNIEEVNDILSRFNFKSIVGHNDTANVFSSVVGVDIPCNRETFTLRNEVLIVGQYRGPRLKEGETTLPKDASIQWMQVELF